MRAEAIVPSVVVVAAVATLLWVWVPVVMPLELPRVYGPYLSGRDVSDWPQGQGYRYVFHRGTVCREWRADGQRWGVTMRDWGISGSAVPPEGFGWSEAVLVPAWSFEEATARIWELPYCEDVPRDPLWIAYMDAKFRGEDVQWEGGPP